MTKISDLINDFSERFSVPLQTVRSVARYLREDNLLTTGPRGINAPDAIPLDAARLLIALIVRTSSVNAASIQRQWGSFITKDEGTARKFQGWNKFEDALAWLLSHYAEGSRSPHSRCDLIVLLDQDRAVLTFRAFDDDDNETHVEGYIFEPELRGPERYGFQVSASVSDEHFAEMATLFCGKPATND
jgi:hypothetical protein